MKRAYFYGDSLTYGFDPRGFYESRYPESVRWTDVLQRRLVVKWDIVVDAANGREIPNAAYEVEHARNTIISHTPFDVFCVMLGTNDYLNMYQPDVVEVTGRMKRFLEDIKAQAPVQMCGSQIILLAPPLIHTLQDEFYAKYDTTNGLFVRAYGALAAHLGVMFYDTTQWGLTPAFDGVHLSEEANLPFADHMEEILEQIGLERDMEMAGSGLLGMQGDM